MPKKIKLVVSDFHLGKGKYLEDGSLNPLEDFFYDDKFIEFLRYYTTGEYRDSELELIINGDFFNLLLVEFRDSPDIITEKDAVEIIHKIFNGHKEVFDALQEIAGRLNSSVTFIVGNHDQGLLWPEVESALRKRISPNIKLFPRFYDFDDIYIEHGNQYEVLHRFDEKNIGIKSAYSDELIQNLPWGSYFLLNFLIQYKLKRPYIDKIKPFRLYLKWALLNDTRFAIEALPKMVWFYSRHRLHIDPAKRTHFKVTWSNIKEAVVHNNLLNEITKLLKTKPYNVVILGHTHIYTHKIIDGKEYFNTGTWNDLISLDISNFGRYSKLTYVLIEYGERGPKCSLKVWRGAYRPEDDVIF